MLYVGAGLGCESSVGGFGSVGVGFVLEMGL